MTRCIIIFGMICMFWGHYLKSVLEDGFCTKHTQTRSNIPSAGAESNYVTEKLLRFLNAVNRWSSCSVFSLRPDPLVSESSARRSDNLYCAQHPLVSTLSSYFLLINFFIDILHTKIFISVEFISTTIHYFCNIQTYTHTHTYTISPSHPFFSSPHFKLILKSFCVRVCQKGQNTQMKASFFKNKSEIKKSQANKSPIDLNTNLNTEDKAKKPWGVNQGYLVTCIFV